MAENSNIEWTDATWNPITGCTMVSAGCTNCYAMGLAATRLRNHPSREGLTRITGGRAVWTGEVRLNEQWLDQPLRWKRRRMIFVCAHGDLFHEAVPDEWIDRVFAVMALAPRHTFQVLTKRPERMREYMLGGGHGGVRAYRMSDAAERIATAFRAWDGNGPTAWDSAVARAITAADWPLPNVWLGVSVEDQATADERIPHLLATPAAVRFVSAEPLLGPVKLAPFLSGGLDHCPETGEDACRGCPGGGPDCPGIWLPCLDWLIVGGESGRGARAMNPNWARSLRDQCVEAGVPFFFKQMGEHVFGTERAQSWGVSPQEADQRIKSYPHWGSPDGKDIIYRVGKKAAGRLLDGREWNQMTGARDA